MARAFVVVVLALALGVGCGGNGGITSDPVTTPAVLRLVATPSVGSIDYGARVEAVVAYPERVSQAQWRACLLLVDDPAAGATCPLPFVILDNWSSEGRFRTQIGTWVLQSADGLGSALFEALEQVSATHPEQLSPCLRAVADDWSACVQVASWPDDCAWQSQDRLAQCTRQQGVDVRVEFSATLDDGGQLEASRRIHFGKTGTPAIGNRNPVLFNLAIDGQALLGDQTLQVPVGTTLLLSPTPFEQSAETYTDETTGQTLTEQLSFSWVRTGGDLDTDYTPFGDALNTLYVPQSSVGTHLTLWVFFEDNRGGIDWTRVGIDPVPTP